MKRRRSLISLMTSAAICFSWAVSLSDAKNSAASRMDMRHTPSMDWPPTVQARTSGLRRALLQVWQGSVPMYSRRRSRVNSLSVSDRRRSRLGITPSKGFLYSNSRPPRHRPKEISSSPEPCSKTLRKGSGSFLKGVSMLTS